MLGIALGLMLQIVVRGVMDGMVREIDAGTRFCMPDLLVTNWPYETGQVLRVPGVCSATACQAGMGTGPHGLCRYSTWYEPEQLAPLLADGGPGRRATCGGGAFGAVFAVSGSGPDRGG